MTHTNHLLALATAAITLTSCTDKGLQPADQNATAETKHLYSNMHQLCTKGTMIGHQDALAYGVEWFADDNRCDFREVTGDYPAIFGWELGHLEIGDERNLDSIRFDDIRRYIIKAYAQGGVNTISWHARNPLTDGTAWDVTSDKVVGSILPGGERHERYMEWLGRLGDFLESLKSADGTPIPIILRPYHELSGSWFWWGKDLCSVEQYKALWQMTFNYLTHDRGLHNLLWAYSMAGYENMAEFMDRYPGNEYVDVVGYDAYQAYDHAERETMLAYLNQQTAILAEVAKATGKIAAITELGYEGVHDNEWYTQMLLPAVQGKGLSYAMLWRNAHNMPGHFYLSYPGHSACDDLVKFVDNEAIFSCTEIGNLYQ